MFGGLRDEREIKPATVSDWQAEAVRERHRAENGRDKAHQERVREALRERSK